MINKVNVSELTESEISIQISDVQSPTELRTITFRKEVIAHEIDDQDKTASSVIYFTYSCDSEENSPLLHASEIDLRIIGDVILDVFVGKQFPLSVFKRARQKPVIKSSFAMFPCVFTAKLGSSFNRTNVVLLMDKLDYHPTVVAKEDTDNDAKSVDIPRE